jgi:uncharacterized protein YerC
MGSYIRTTPESRQRICDLYKAGRTLPQIATETGFSEATVGNVVRAAGIVGAGRTTGIRTSPETEALVMEMYGQGKTWREIMERSGVTEHTVSAIIKRNGGEIGRKHSLSAEDWQRAVALYEDGMDAPEIGHRLGCHSSMIYYVLEREGIDRREQIACDDPGYFDQIDTPEKAYWLGFIGADGCVTGSKYLRLQVKLARKDRDHLVLLQQAVKARRPVRDHEELTLGVMRPYSTLAVYSPPLAEALISHGITRRKSATLQPWDGPAALMPHYWRGLVDGDGHITINGNGVYMGLLGSKPVADTFAAWVNDLIGSNVHATPKKPSTTAWCVQVGGRIGVLSLLAALYDDAPVALARKKALADLAVHGKPLQAALI